MMSLSLAFYCGLCFRFSIRVKLEKVISGFETRQAQNHVEVKVMLMWLLLCIVLEMLMVLEGTLLM